ncbi:hypothetical protein Btru_036948 [Bulinus truncatus]|nr:hypothetical protein Btru_036948 [Bulinus truncatus]
MCSIIIFFRLHASFSSLPELDTAVRGGGNKNNIMSVAADMDTADQDDADEEQGEDAFMTIGRHLRKEGGWYRLLRALKKRQIEREKRRAALERKDFSAKYKKKKKRMNMQGLSLVYESAIECLVYLENRRPIDPQTATLVAGGAECWLRFWSLHPKGGLLGQFTSTRRKLESIRCMTTDKNNEYLITGDTMGLLRIWDIKEFCNADKLTTEEREEREKRLKKTFVYSRLPFKPEEILDTMEKLREKRISVPDASKPRKNLKSPRLLSSVRCHTQPIISVELIDERNLILTASQDRTVRLWTKNCTYIGTFGEIWKPIPMVVGAVVEKFPRLPKDIQRCASARSLATLHNGKMPKWRTACYVVRRHIYEQRREKQLEGNKAKQKAERSARGEPESEESLATSDRYVSKILGKYYVPRRRYKGPMDLKEQGFPPLVIFKGRCAPYQTTLPRPIFPMEPLYKPPTFFDIDSRRPLQYKTRRQTRNMMNIFNQMCGDPMRYGQNSRSQSGSSWGSTPTKRASQALASKSDTMDQNSNLDIEPKKVKDRSANQTPTRSLLYDANTNETAWNSENSSTLGDDTRESSSYTSTNYGSAYRVTHPFNKRSNDLANRLWNPRFPGEGRHIRQKLRTGDTRNVESEDEDESQSGAESGMQTSFHAEMTSGMGPDLMKAVRDALNYDPYTQDSDDTDSDLDMTGLGFSRFLPETFGIVTSALESTDVKLPPINQNNSKFQKNIKYSHLL